MKIIFRISNGGNNKYKPSYVYDKKLMFTHFINIFKENDVYVFADNINEDTYNYMCEKFDKSKIMRTELGNSKSFLFCVNFVISNFDMNEKIYFAEDDYIYTRNAAKIIEEGLSIAHYSSGYDHPDKYINHNEGGPNPFIENGGELSRVLITDNSHWKFTNSCCMTFATTVKVIKEDFDIFKRYCNDSTPCDFAIFCDLHKYKNRKLVSCIPSVSTHGEVEWLAKFVDWESEFNKSLQNV
jgi:hypothetical protein